jgi:hypothetical protein
VSCAIKIIGLGCVMKNRKDAFGCIRKMSSIIETLPMSKWDTIRYLFILLESWSSACNIMARSGVDGNFERVTDRCY